MFRREQDVRAHVAWLAAAATCVLAISLIMLPPVIGVADNGDFSRLMRLAGFQYLDPDESYDDRYFAYAHQYFGYKSNWGSSYVTTQVVLLSVVGWLARLFDGEVFDIRWLGAVYTGMLATAIYLFIRNADAVAGNRAATAIYGVFAAGMLLFVFGDIGYLAYFHSFYGEPYALLGMLLSVAAIMAMTQADKPSGWQLALLVSAAVAVATSKIQHAPFGFAFGLIVWRMAGLRDDKRWRRMTHVGLGILLGSSVLMLVFAPGGLKQINLYQSVFYGILKDSPDARRDMMELGIPERYLPLAGTNYFQKDVAIPQDDPVLRREVLQKLSHKDVALYYLRHPERLWQKLNKAAENGVSVRPSYLGNYDASAGKPRGALSDTFDTYSDWKSHHMPHSLSWFAGCWLAYLAVLGLLWRNAVSRRVRARLETMAIISLCGLFALVVPILGDGEADLGKHLFMFNVCFDMMLISAALFLLHLAVNGMARRMVSNRKEQNGCQSERSLR